MRMDEDPRHAERVGDEAGVLSRGAAEAAQRIARDIVAALHRDVLDRVRHVADRDLHEALGDLLRASTVAYLLGELCKSVSNNATVQRLVAARSEHVRKEARLDLAEHHV